MAIRGSELLLIVRAQNQASGALRRVGADMATLGRYGNVALKQQQVAIQQSNVMRQRQRALNELAAVSPGGKRYASVQQARVRLTNEEANASRRLATNLENQKLKTRELVNAQQRQRSALGSLGAASRGQDPFVTAGARSQYEKASIQTQRYKNQLQGLGDQEKQLRSQLATMPVAFKQNDRAMAGLGARANVLNSELSTLAAREKLLVEQQVALERAMGRQRMWSNVGTTGRTLQHLGRVLQMFGLVATAGIGLAARAAANYNTQITLAATQTRKAGQSFVASGRNSEYLQKQILSLMKQFPIASEEYAQAAYDVYSSTDVSLGGGVKLLKLFSKAAVAGMTDIGTATDAGISVMNSFGFSVKQMPAIMQRMFSSVRFGRMTFAEFAKTLSVTAPAAKAAGQTFDTLAGSMAFLTRRLDVRKASVGFARLIEILGRKKFVEGLHAAGVEITGVGGRMLQLPVIMDRLLAKFPQLAKGGTLLRTFFKDMSGTEGTIMARRAFVYLATQLPLYHKMMGQVVKDNNEFSQSWDAMARTPGVKWGVFVNQLKALMIEMGTAIMPAIVRMIEPLRQAAKWFNNLSDSAKNTIGRWLAYAAVFALVGGTIMSLTGSLIRLVAFFGSRGMLVSGFFGALAAGVLVISVLKGEIHSLTDVVNSLVGAMTGHGVMGWALGLTAVGVAVYKVANAFKAMAVAETAVGIGGAAGAGGGILGMMMGLGRGTKAAGGIVGANVKAFGLLKGTLAGAAISAAMIPGPLMIAGAAIGVAAGGAYLWKRHMDAVAAAAARLKAEFKELRVSASMPRRQGDVFQGLVGSVDSIMRTRISIRDIRRNIADLRGQLKGTAGDKRQQILDQITLQTLDLATAQRTLGEAYAKSNTQFQAFGAGFAAFIPNAAKLKALNTQLQDLILRRNRMAGTPGGLRGGSILGDIDKQIAQTRDKMRVLTAEMRNSAISIRAAFVNVVTQLGKMGQIPMPSSKAIADLFNVSKRLGRMVTIPEMKAIIKAEVDPAARRRLPAEIASIFRNVRAQRIKVEIDTKAQQKATAAVKKAQAAVPKAFKFPQFTFPNPAGQAKAARAKAAKVLTPLHQKIHVDPPKNLAQIGATISTGIQMGMTPVTQTVIENVIKNPILKAIESGSPSKWAAREVGKPIMQGISLGVLQNVGLLEKAATASIEYFQSAAIQKAQEGKKKISDALLIGDVRMQARSITQFNNAIAKLGRRHVPKQLIDELAAQGPAAAKFIAQIANMSEKELKRYVAAWNRANNQVKRSVRATQADIKKATKDMHDQLLSTIQDMYSSLRETTAGQFGDLFAGIDPATYGEGLAEARANYASQIKDFQGQIGDLNNQLVDTQKEASQRLIDAIAARKDELQQAFGQLFGGDWLTSTTVQTKLDWGKKLGFDDLQKDLQSQVDKFKQWRSLLVSLAAKVPPELGAQLEALGPEAVDKLAVLNSGTDAQIAQYVATWQDGQNQMQTIANKTTVDTSDITARMADIVKQISDVVAQMAQLQYPKELTGQDLINDLQKQMDQWNLYQGLLQGLIDKGLPPEFIEQLEAMGPAAIPMLQALNKMSAGQLDKYIQMWQEKEDIITTDTLKHLNRQLDLWFDYGVNIAQNIINGMRSQGDYLSDYFSELIKSLMEQTALPQPQNPRPTGANGPVHIGGSTSQSGQYIPGTPSTYTGGTGGGVVSNYNLTVNQASGESLSSTLEKATFRLDNRRVE